MNRTPMPPRKKPMARGTGLARSGAPRRKRFADLAPVELAKWAESENLRREKRAAPRRDTIPRKVRLLVNARDPWCQMTGSPSGLEMHHRRPKQMGGDPRPHTDCACNLIRLTRKQHRWVHRHRDEAEAMGLLLPAETVLPGSVSVMRASEDGGITSYAHCDGTWREYEQEDMEAA